MVLCTETVTCAGAQSGAPVSHTLPAASSHLDTRPGRTFDAVRRRPSPRPWPTLTLAPPFGSHQRAVCGYRAPQNLPEASTATSTRSLGCLSHGHGCAHTGQFPSRWQFVFRPGKEAAVGRKKGALRNELSSGGEKRGAGPGCSHPFTFTHSSFSQAKNMLGTVLGSEDPEVNLARPRPRL